MCWLLSNKSTCIGSCISNTGPFGTYRHPRTALFFNRLKALVWGEDHKEREIVPFVHICDKYCHSCLVSILTSYCHITFSLSLLLSLSCSLMWGPASPTHPTTLSGKKHQNWWTANPPLCHHFHFSLPPFIIRLLSYDRMQGRGLCASGAGIHSGGLEEDIMHSWSMVQSWEQQ